MAGRGTAPRWPAGVLPFVTVGSFFIGIAVAFVPASRPLPGFKQFFALGMKVFGSVAANQAVMCLGGLAHVVEGLYVLRICARHKVPAAHAWGWFGLTCLMGYPAIAGLQAALKRR